MRQSPLILSVYQLLCLYIKLTNTHLIKTQDKGELPAALKIIKLAFLPTFFKLKTMVALLNKNHILQIHKHEQTTISI
jgi:hypothetical protein